MSHQPPDGGGQDRGGGGSKGAESTQPKTSYSDRLKTNVRYDQRLKRNVLEITLEKTDPSVDIDVDEDGIGRIFKSLGMDIVSQVQGYQVKYMGKISILSAWMAAGISLERFCKDVSIKVSNSVTTGMIRPAGKKDVMVSIVGLDFNTPDSFLVDYLNKFGHVLNTVAIYSKFEKGLFKGKFNGERKFQVDFSKSSKQMGTFHLIDGNKVRVFYRGNRKTCGRCHKSADDWPGEAIAKTAQLEVANKSSSPIT